MEEIEETRREKVGEKPVGMKEKGETRRDRNDRREPRRDEGDRRN